MSHPNHQMFPAGISDIVKHKQMTPTVLCLNLWPTKSVGTIKWLLSVTKFGGNLLLSNSKPYIQDTKLTMINAQTVCAHLQNMLLCIFWQCRNLWMTQKHSHLGRIKKESFWMYSIIFMSLTSALFKEANMWQMESKSKDISGNVGTQPFTTAV